VENGQVTDVGLLPNRPITVASLINDNEQIIGTSFPYNTNDPNLPPQSFVWQNGELAVLPGLGGNSIMNGLNNQGKIVGSIQDSSPVRRYAFQYHVNTGTLVDLDAAVGRPAGWQLSTATAINDAGQIIGEGEHNGESRSYLLTPL
jgi:uncharacterized membrane protein